MANSIQNKKLDYNGGVISYEVHNSEGEKTPIVLVHGQLLNKKSWGLLIEDLENQGHPIILYDRRGHGESNDPTQEYTESDDLRVLLNTIKEEFRDDFIEEGFILGGHSSGGGIILNYLDDLNKEEDISKEDPILVKKVFLIDSSLGNYIPPREEKFEISSRREAEVVEEKTRDTQEEEKREIQPEEAVTFSIENEKLKLLNLPALVELKDSDVEGKNKTYGLVSKMIGEYGGWHLKPENVKKYGEWHRDSWNIHERLENIKCPVKIIVGSEDEQGLPNARKIKEDVKNSELRIIEGAGHFANCEKPDEVNKEIIDFIEGKEGQEDRTEIDADSGKEGEENHNFGINNK